MGFHCAPWRMRRGSPRTNSGGQREHSPAGSNVRYKPRPHCCSLYNGGQVRCVSNSRKVRITEFLIGLLDTGAGESGRIQNDGAAGIRRIRATRLRLGLSTMQLALRTGLTSKHDLQPRGREDFTAAGRAGENTECIEQRSPAAGAVNSAYPVIHANSSGPRQLTTDNAPPSALSFGTPPSSERPRAAASTGRKSGLIMRFWRRQRLGWEGWPVTHLHWLHCFLANHPPPPFWPVTKLLWGWMFQGAWTKPTLPGDISTAAALEE